MSICKSIKEFDIITCNPDYKDNNNLKFIKKEYFEELDRFVRKNTPDEEAIENGALVFLKLFLKKAWETLFKQRIMSD